MVFFPISISISSATWCISKLLLSPIFKNLQIHKENFSFFKNTRRGNERRVKKRGENERETTEGEKRMKQFISFFQVHASSPMRLQQELFIFKYHNQIERYLNRVRFGP
ncbi:hypothetical protein CIPAW_05G191600 [Carya illinoinensis]|uniref:Uncharacterized protein n=1 Tax=Carya illinoinensis TaxID=32201 RepID=A0A8T1QLV6_CARIL|nr:hypothetical protein CIPAW_05G191600 [Carya illinoinensis]